MRYLGNKTSILLDIENILAEKHLLHKKMVFFDAFCGSGAVADYLKRNYQLIINDNLRWSTVYTRGRIEALNCSFEKLGLDPFEYLNTKKTVKQGFFYKNYSPAESNRMYFSSFNAGRIDFFRWQIESWYSKKKITEEEYNYLLASLIESVSAVSNTAGVYGAFLKKWDSRAIKPIKFLKVEYTPKIPNKLTVYNDKIEDIIDRIDCDILYLDPPYTQNQYGTQYHLLETLILNDNPTVSKVTGSRKTAPFRSAWSQDIKSHILLDWVLAKTKAKYILMSYNNDGFMSKEYIESVMKRYGKTETFLCKKINYKKYQNWKSKNTNPHFEYLFFIEKREKKDIVYESPLNYIGSKAKIIHKIKDYLPRTYSKFFDVFGGGFNVGGNIEGVPVVYNDINPFVTGIIESFKKYTTYSYVQFMKAAIKKFNLSKGNQIAYRQIRAYYNSFPIEKRDPRLLLTVILYGYLQQIRFNGNHNFNNPAGVRWFNDKVLEKMISFCRHLQENDCSFFSGSYTELSSKIQEGDLVYLDPPYMLTNGSYNDGKRGFLGWDKKQEQEMFHFIDNLDKCNIKFMLSYVVSHRGKINYDLLQWIEDNGYRLIPLGTINGISGQKRDEIIVMNYAK